MGVDEKRTEVLRQVFRDVGSLTDDNKELVEKAYFYDGEIKVDGRSLSSVLWDMEDAASKKDAIALRAAVLLVVDLEDWLLYEWGKGKQSKGRRA